MTVLSRLRNQNQAHNNEDDIRENILDWLRSSTNIYCRFAAIHVDALLSPSPNFLIMNFYIGTLKVEHQHP